MTEQTSLDGYKQYQEPLELQGPGLFSEDGFETELEAAFEAFKRACGQDRSPVGMALRDQYDAAFSDFAKLWHSYFDGRQAERRASQAQAKPNFVRLGEQIEEMKLTLSDFTNTPDLRRYLFQGIRQRLNLPVFERPQGPRALIDSVIDNLDLLKRVCQAEVELQHRPGEREDIILKQACESMRQIILHHAGVRIPKSISISKDGKFQSAKVETFYRLILCIDPKLSASQVRTVLQKLPKLPKTGKIQN